MLQCFGGKLEKEKLTPFQSFELNKGVLAKYGGKPENDRIFKFKESISYKSTKKWTVVQKYWSSYWLLASTVIKIRKAQDTTGSSGKMWAATKVDSRVEMFIIYKIFSRWNMITDGVKATYLQENRSKCILRTR